MQQSSPPGGAPNDNLAYRFPVSVKGVVFSGDQAVLLLNPRNEWELPGGKLELGETPRECVAREVAEELGLPVQVGPLLDSWVYHIAPGVDVLIVTYGCYPQSSGEAVHSAEHQAVGLFKVDQVPDLNMPQGYRDSIIEWSRRLNLETSGP
jgi:mutator protein MutT